MKLLLAFFMATLSGGVFPARGQSAASSSRPGVFAVRGVLVERSSDGLTAVIRHEEVPNYMPAMTMSFKAKSTNELAGLEAGDQITFQLHVTDDRSWIDRVAKTGRRDKPSPPSATGGTALPRSPDLSSASSSNATAGSVSPDASRQPRHPLLDYKFTNELGAPVSFNDFRGQVIAYTFFFTRCPVPEYCPRLSRNFEEVSTKLEAMPGAPANWHLISVSFDPAFDTPGVLKAYASRYHYDSNHWTFLTGPKEQIGELARLSGVNYQPDAGLFTHNFRTLVINPAGALVKTYPVGGDLSVAIVADILKAAGATNLPPSKRVF